MRHSFTYEIFVPNDAKQIAQADGYYEELSNVTKFVFTEEEYNYLRFQSGIYDAIDNKFGTIIMECEEDRIEADCIEVALAIIIPFRAKAETMIQIKAVDKLIAAFEYAKHNGMFLEFVNGTM